MKKSLLTIYIFAFSTACSSDVNTTLENNSTSSNNTIQSNNSTNTIARQSSCGCPLGDGPYCGKRAMNLSADLDCELDLAVQSNNTLYDCTDGLWTELESCQSDCVFDTGVDTSPNDRCLLPECECFVQVAYCGSGAEKVAEEMGCQIPLLPENRGDILHCPGGQWAVRESCEDGCIEAPQGTPDSCKTESDYLLPVECAELAQCTNGNHTRTHTGKDAYDYDFGMPVGADVLAMRGGSVSRVRMVSLPGSSCYDGGGSSCANYANTVEVKHSDGTVALYMHLSTISISEGTLVGQGDLLGKSGNTGWSTGAHTHVQVQSDCGSWWCQSIPFTFGEQVPIERGHAVESKNCDSE